MSRPSRTPRTAAEAAVLALGDAVCEPGGTVETVRGAAVGVEPHSARPKNAKPMVCCDCGQRIVATLDQAQRHGWALWVGGGRCRRCVNTVGREPLAGTVEEGKAER